MMTLIEHLIGLGLAWAVIFALLWRANRRPKPTTAHRIAAMHMHFTTNAGLLK